MAELTRTGNYLRDQHKDKFKILEEAMYKSKGKANYAFFADMLYSDTVTADDIAKIANGFSDEALDKIKRDSTTDYLWVKNNRQRRRLVGNERESGGTNSVKSISSKILSSTVLWRRLV